MSGVELSELCRQIVVAKSSSYIALKVPVNTDVQELKDVIPCPLIVHKYRKMLIIIVDVHSKIKDATAAENNSIFEMDTSSLVPVSVSGTDFEVKSFGEVMKKTAAQPKSQVSKQLANSEPRASATAPET